MTLIGCPWHHGKVPAVRVPLAGVWSPTIPHHYADRSRAWAVAFHRITERGHREACKGSRNLIAVVRPTAWPTDEVNA